MKILIISYYAFPLNAVASYRIESFCEGFTQQGADVTLLTRHWGESFKSWEDILSSNEKEPEIKHEKGYRQIFLPYKAKPKDSKFRLISTLSTFKNYLLGNLQTETNAYANFKAYALDLLKKESDFDLVLVSSPPNNLIRLASYLYNKTNIPYVLDIRDFLNDRYLMKQNKEDFKSYVLNTFTFLHVKKWMKNATLVTTVSPILANVFRKKYNKNTILALNGYEQKYFQNEKLVVYRNKTFTIRHLGSAYQGFDFKPIIYGISKFMSKNPNVKVNIELIGMHNSQIEGEFLKAFNSQNLKIIKNRVSKNVVIDKTINSDVLLLAWNLYKGNYGTKLFDYLASGSHILLCPPDNSVVEDLIRKHENGSVANTSDEVCAVLEEQYKLWEEGKNKTKINNYPQFARENIAVDLYQELKQIVDANQ
ncbi:hypothetical protein CW751_01130 [Brumimicrobium salinarum]|uniref:Glycosyltransferase subfamily 4-like N-terminal domain-containing protein n=1 Tax=Brumimicrobium salinarum TaxID=2058658 RepID=A0A2I0R6I2_9FLAO|nr:hypothetical protein [Brumimicrobium salinarum]PKR81970.1 hypothetical protein CW751_01130 [Brumimicrobium salinarum]